MPRTTRDNFKARTVTTLAKRVGYLCSNPDCNAYTSGPHQDASDSSNVGVAAHICAASPGGPRYRAEMTTDARCCAENGIWLCQNCARMVDVDPTTYPEMKLQIWKHDAESAARSRMGKPKQPKKSSLSKFEKEISQKLNMRDEMTRRMLKNPVPHRSWPPLRPYNKFKESEVIIRNVEEHSTYPEIPERRGISPWFKAEMWDFYHSGFEIVLSIQEGVIDDEGNWAILYRNEPFDTQRFKVIRLWVVGRIPFSEVFRVDWDGDEYYHLMIRDDSFDLPLESTKKLDSKKLT